MAHQGAETWLNELIWREFYIISCITIHMCWNRIPGQCRIYAGATTEHFAAWCAGRTGYPIVDAAMRQLVDDGLDA